MWHFNQSIRYAKKWNLFCKKHETELIPISSAAKSNQPKPKSAIKIYTIATVEEPPYARCCCWCFFIIHIIVIIEMRKASQNMTMANNIDGDDEHQTMNMLFLVCRFELIINVPLKRKTLKWVSECVKQLKRSKIVVFEYTIESWWNMRVHEPLTP